MGVVVLTGPAAAGKNTIANLLARKRDKGADIDVDLVRWMHWPSVKNEDFCV